MKNEAQIKNELEKWDEVLEGREGSDFAYISGILWALNWVLIEGEPK